MVFNAGDMRMMAEESKPFPAHAGEETESEEKEN